MKFLANQANDDLIIWLHFFRNPPFVMPLKPLDYDSPWKCRRCSSVMVKTDVENMVARLMGRFWKNIQLTQWHYSDFGSGSIYATFHVKCETES